MQLPLVSIIVPVYNGAETIGPCLDALLRQDYPAHRYETIVVDNRSTDATARIVRQYPVKYLFEGQHQSSYAARNRGIRASRGSILAFTDADCVACSDWLSQAVGGFEAGVGCVAGQILDLPSSPDNKLYLDGSMRQQPTLADPFLPYAQTANALFRREVCEQVGLFEPLWRSGGDADLAWRMQLQSPYTIKFVPDAVVRHRPRSTCLAVFCQRMKWGFGRAFLSRKYGLSAREVLTRRFRRFVTLSRSLLRSRLHGANPNQRRRRSYWWIHLIGYEIGRIIGYCGALPLCAETIDGSPIRHRGRSRLQ